MSSSYCILSPAHAASMPLDEEQFRELKRARKRLSSAYAIRHKYKLVRTNYGLITEALKAVGTAYLDDAHPERLIDAKTRLNAAVNNYILSGRTFTAQIKRHVQASIQDRSEINRITRRMEIEYQRSFAYRFVDSLYDYVSYYGISVHEIEISGQPVYDSPDAVRRYEIKAYIDRDFLGGPTDFRASVLKETPRSIELVSLLDEFMGCLDRINDLARQITDETTINSHVLVKEFINVFAGSNGVPVNNLFVVHSMHGDDNNIYDKFPISMYVDQQNLEDEYR